MRFFLFTTLAVVSVFFCHELLAFETRQPTNQNVDSLLSVIQQEDITDSLRMDALINLGFALWSIDPKASMKYSKQGLNLAHELNSPRHLARAYVSVGHVYWRLGNFNKSFDYLKEARSLFLANDNIYGYTRTGNHLGILFAEQGHFDKALEYYIDALQSYEEMDSIARSASVLNNIGIVYMRQGDLDKAEEYHMQSLLITSEVGNPVDIAYSLNNLGRVSQKRGNYEQALEYQEASRNIWAGSYDSRQLAIVNRDIGYLLFLMEDYAAATEQMYKTLELFESIGDEWGAAKVFGDLGELYIALHDYQQAMENLEKSLSMAKQSGIPALVLENYRKMSRLLGLQENYSEAYHYQNLYFNLQDSLYTEESRRRAVEIKLMYDRERKENEIQLLRKSNRIKELNLEKQKQFRNFLFLIIFLILALLILLYTRFLEIRKTNKVLEFQKEEIGRTNQQLRDLNDSLLSEKKKVEDLNEKLMDSEKSLIEINKTKDKFFSIISHDLRNPFASIVSFSRILKRDIDNLSKKELKDLTKELDRSVVNINSLLENLLQWSRSQTGQITYQPEYFDLNEIVKENLDLFAKAANDKNIQIVNLISVRVDVWADINMTDTIIRNLISNALKYTHPGGHLEINAQKTNGFLEVSVKDDGVGISEEDQKKLFRIDSLFSTYGTLDEKGSGLGLLLCNEFVKKQGGQMHLQSEKGKGSVFSFTIPHSAPDKNSIE
ncbi:MAG: hypothetical protein EA394_05960 [Bacteroidia bacterium]|nr:MAG: hypothetical protein EA394_05960 [Bacteroidia bacterium]